MNLARVLAGAALGVGLERFRRSLTEPLGGAPTYQATQENYARLRREQEDADQGRESVYAQAKMVDPWPGPPYHSGDSWPGQDR